MEHHGTLIQLIIAYTLVAAFVFTVIITCLSLIGLIQFRHKEQQQKLYYLLVVELVVVCLAWFNGYLNAESVKNSIVAENTKEIQEDKDTLFDEIIAHENSSSPERLIKMLPKDQILQQSGWVYFGEYKNKKWKKRNFNLADNLPKPDKTYKAEFTITIREGYPAFPKYAIKKRVGLIKPGDKVLVKEVKTVGFGKVWALIETM